MATGLVKVIKQAALDAVENSKPTVIKYGTVTSVAPLTVRITNEFFIPSSMLVVPKRLVNDDPLEVNDKVALLRQKGGQSYFVLDKI